MKTIKLAGKTFELEESYNELSFEKFLKLQKISSDEPDFIACMLGIEKEELLKMNDPDLDLKFFPEVGWFYETMEIENIPMPETITIKDKILKIPKDLGFKTYQQKILASDKLLQVTDDDAVDTVMPFVIGVYLYPLVHGDDALLDKDVIELFASSVILKLPFIEMFPLGNFFFGKLTDLLNSKIKDLGMSPQSRRVRRASKV